MHRFFVTLQQIEGRVIRFRPEQAHQIGRVLRMHPGDSVIVLDGTGLAYEVSLQEIEADNAVGHITRHSMATGEPRTHLTLYQSLLKRDKFEWVLQKGTEIGVSHFVPVITSRTLVRDTESVTPEKLARWQRIVTEAAEQSGRGRLPTLAKPIPFDTAAAEATTSSQRVLIAWEQPTTGDLATALDGLPESASVALFIGPEGGYEPGEVELVHTQGGRVVTFGPRILRTETAALVGPALILHALGDMGLEDMGLEDKGLEDKGQ